MKHDKSYEYCPDATCNDPRGAETMDEARSAGTISTIGFVVGALGLGTGPAIWL